MNLPSGDCTDYLFSDVSLENVGRKSGKLSHGTTTFYAGKKPDFSLNGEDDFLSGTSSLLLPRGRTDRAELEGILRGLDAISMQAMETKYRARVLVHCDNHKTCRMFRREFRGNLYPGIESVRCSHVSRNDRIIERCDAECSAARQAHESTLPQPLRKRKRGHHVPVLAAGADELASA